MSFGHKQPAEHAAGSLWAAPFVGGNERLSMLPESFGNLGKLTHKRIQQTVEHATGGSSTLARQKRPDQSAGVLRRELAGRCMTLPSETAS